MGRSRKVFGAARSRAVFDGFGNDPTPARHTRTGVPLQKGDGRPKPPAYLDGTKAAELVPPVKLPRASPETFLIWVRRLTVRKCEHKLTIQSRLRARDRVFNTGLLFGLEQRVIL